MSKKSGTEKMPALFVGHGSPMNAILDNDFTRRLERLSQEIPTPKAILVVSAHWLTEGTLVNCLEKPKTIYDFYGFPAELYRLKYPALGSPSFARLAAKSVKSTQVKCDYDWGLDHASWVVLRHMYPKAEVPVFEMSIDYSPYNEWRPKSLEYYYDLAKELAVLREMGVLIVGSGNIVHNLGLIDFDMNAEPFDWAVAFDAKVKKNLVEHNYGELLNYLKMGREATLAVPTLDHYLPMVYIMALREEGERLDFVYEGFQHGSVSMRAFQIG
jgi:4,5-DOPA dioxygenase extradiol